MREAFELNQEAGFATRSIHVGQNFRSETGAVIPPIYMTSTFETGNPGGFDYTRSGNPNFRNLQANLASLESAKYATIFASGISSISAIFFSLKAGDVILSESNIYGATYRLFEKVLRRFNISIEYVNFTKDEGIKRIGEIKPALVWIESPTNPLLKIIDITKLADECKKAGSQLAVDNTFASSYLQQPIRLGATLSQLSTTKYTNGHSDCLGGAVCTDSEEWQEKMIFAQKALGLQPSPFDAWLVSRGSKTEALRMEKHSSNALWLSEQLEKHPRVQVVNYPFLSSHPQYRLAKLQMKLGGGMVVVDFGMSYEQTLKWISKLHLFTQAESLGGVESLVAHPASMTHGSIPKETREKVGIRDGMVRLSVGIEDPQDLWEDLQQALEQVK
jgi:cystathionine gamma-synthase